MDENKKGDKDNIVKFVNEEDLEVKYFSKSKNQWIKVSDMSDTHVRRAFKKLLRDKNKKVNNIKDITLDISSVRDRINTIIGRLK